MDTDPSTLDFEPYCNNCAAYCCVALAFDEGDMFAYNKDAAEPCKHLGSDHKCNIHGKLSDSGFRGCVRYNCFGAGQRVTNQLFDGRSWRDHPSEAQEMFDSFRVVQKVHEHLLMLKAAKNLDLSPAQRAQIQNFEQALMQEDVTSLLDVLAFEHKQVFDDIGVFFTTLQDRF